MKKALVFCIAAVSLEKTGKWLTAKDKDHFVDWVHDNDKQFFRDKVKDSRVAVMGKNTYQTMATAFPDKPGLGYARNIVYSYPNEGPLPGNPEITQENPKDLVERLTKEGYTKIAVIGGADIYTQFMQAGIVDIFYVTVHHNIQFGEGIPLFQDDSLQLPKEPQSREWLSKAEVVELLTYNLIGKEALT